MAIAKNFNKTQDYSKLLRKFAYSTSFILVTALSGCSMNNEFVSAPAKKEMHANIPEYSYVISYQSEDIKHSYSTKFIYDNPFQITGTKSKLDYELDAKFSQFNGIELITPFIENNKNINSTFFVVNLKKNKRIRYGSIAIPKINNGDELTETIEIHNKSVIVKINDITGKWSKNSILDLHANSNSVCFPKQQTLHTGMKMVLYLYNYPSTLNLNHKINFVLDSVQNPTVELSINSISKNIFKQLSMDKYVIKTGTSDKYFLGNNVLSINDNSFSVYKLIKRKAF